MFSFIKSLFGDTPQAAVVPKSSIAPQAEPVPMATPLARVPVTVPAPAGPSLEIPLASVTDRLNPALRSHLLRSPTSGDMLKLPLATALEQLPQGAVRISFRELRQGAPGLFMGATELDE